jgi:two-component system chemotaxis response regulator CheB
MPTAERKTRVLVVDDSAIARRVLTATLRKDPGIEVVAEAGDALTANALVAQFRPDVVTLDLDMPQMDGLTFLQHLMRHHRIPVVIVSSSDGTPATAEALRLGAVDVIVKPQSPSSLDAFGRRVHQRMRELREALLQINPGQNGRRDNNANAAPAARPPQLRAVSPSFKALIAIGASVGGPEAIETVLAHLPSDCPPVVIVQHMPASFTKQFAKRLDQTSAMHVVEAEDQQEIARGGAYLAPGDHHMTVERQQGRLRAIIRRGAAVNHQRPSVDVMFQSLLGLTGVPIVGVLLTGMGDDGADGMVALSHAGHETIAEDEQTCVVFGMPCQAIARGGAMHVAPLPQIAETIYECLGRLETRARNGGNARGGRRGRSAERRSGGA